MKGPGVDPSSRGHDRAGAQESGGLTRSAGGVQDSDMHPPAMAVEPLHLARYVHARVSAEGRTRVLLISSHKDIRRTIAKFGARQAILARQVQQCHLVLDKYRR